VQDLGVQSTTLNRDPAALRHITVTGGEAGLVHLWLAADAGSRRLRCRRAGSSPSGRPRPEVRFVASRNLPRARRV